MTLMDENVVDRTPLASAGVTGARLERVTMADGRVLVEKTVDQRSDWLMRATGDDGRVFRLWQAGVFHRLPAGIDSAIEHVEPQAVGWTVVMRDVSEALVPPGQLLSRERSRRVMTAASALHAAFAGTGLDGLCPIVDRLAFLTPSSVRGVVGHPLRDTVLAGWDRFADLAPADVSGAVLELVDRPGRLAAALGTYPSTLLHGDLKVANIGFDGDSVVLLDWGTLTGTGPAALDLAWYVAVNGAAVDASLDELLADAHAALAAQDREALPLALLGQLVLLGWDKALGATSDDPATQARERAGLAWWCDRAAEALERWSPA
ncbi:MAG: phosphotransferase [Acidimicrobiales bacterium]